MSKMHQDIRFDINNGKFFSENNSFLKIVEHKKHRGQFNVLF